MNINHRNLIVCFLLLFIFISGCGYQPTTSIPPDMSKIAIKPFKNSSSEPNLENRLTEEVTQQMLAHGSLEVVGPDQADVILKGQIKSYRKIPTLYNEQDVPQQYKLRVEILLKLIDPRTNKMLRGFKNIFRETIYSDIIPPVETEYQAQRRVIDQLARDVVTSTVEGWPYMQE